MKCPLKFKLQDITSEKERIYTGHCLREGCAWWDTAFDMCTCRSIARQLDGMLADMHWIAKRMPKDLAPRG